MAEIRHLENRHDVIFSAEGGQIWIKFRRLVQNDMSTAVIWSKSKPDVDFQYGGRFGESHVISEPPATLQGATTCRIQCHDPRATCYIAGCCHLAKSMSWSCHFRGCNNSISHIENRFSPYFILFLFFNAIWALTIGGFRIVSDTLVNHCL